MTEPLTDDERRILTQFGGVAVCRFAVDPVGQAKWDVDAKHHSTMEWPGHDIIGGHATRTGFIVYRFDDHDIITGQVRQALAKLTWKRVEEWAATIPEELAEQARSIAYPYPQYAACEELAVQLLAPTPSDDLELTLF